LRLTPIALLDTAENRERRTATPETGNALQLITGNQLLQNTAHRTPKADNPINSTNSMNA